MNPEAMFEPTVAGAVSPQTLAQNLPDAAYFDVTYEAVQDNDLTKFYD
jgi:hypothetical protein